jgi:uncharacterized protein (DUF1697 family)
MAEVRACLTAAGFEKVETYIQTGNVRVVSRLRSRERVEAELERAFADHVGFEVPTMVVSPAELTATYAEAVAADVGAARRYVSFLKEPPDPAAKEAIEAWNQPGEGARVLGRAILWWLDHPTAAAKMSNARMERLVGTATTRDLKVVATLAERWGSAAATGKQGPGKQGLAQ